MDRFVQAWWLRVPIRLRRVNRLLSEAWFDGAYLTAWPKVALIAPAMVFLFGLLEGATHWSYVAFAEGRVSGDVHAVDFAQMLPLLFVAVICGALSSQLGLLLVAGYALGELFLAPSPFGQGPDLVWRLTHLYAPQLISYYAFALLAVTPTLTAKAMAASLPAWLRKRSVAFVITGGAVACFVESASVYGWTAAAPMIVRVHWLWAGGKPPIALVDFMPKLNPQLPATAVVVMAIRLWLSVIARKTAPQAALAGTRRDMAAMDINHPQGMIVSCLQAFGLALVTMVTICGLFNSLGRAVWVFAIVLGLSLTRFVLLPKVPIWQWWGQLANKLPLPLRWAASIIIAFAFTRAVLLKESWTPLANRDAGTFGVEIFCFLVSLAVALVLFPAVVADAPVQPSQKARRGGQLAVLLCAFVIATQPVYASICLDPFCCFGANSLIAALAIAALLLAALPGLFALAGIADLGLAAAFLFDAMLSIAPLSMEAAMAAIEAEGTAATEEGVAAVIAHLERFDAFLQNTMMIERLQAALESGQLLSGGDLNFYLHELYEAELMGEGMEYDPAHKAALEFWGHSRYSVYAREVVNALPDIFNSNWRNFWGLEPL